MILPDEIWFYCDCKGFQRGHGITYDAQDYREFRITACPWCEKPWPNKERYELIKKQRQDRQQELGCFGIKQDGGTE